MVSRLSCEKISVKLSRVWFLALGLPHFHQHSHGARNRPTPASSASALARRCPRPPPNGLAKRSPVDGTDRLGRSRHRIPVAKEEHTRRTPSPLANELKNRVDTGVLLFVEPTAAAHAWLRDILEQLSRAAGTAQFEEVHGVDLPLRWVDSACQQ